MLTSLYLVASAAVLAAGMYVAQSYYVDGRQDVPDVGTWGDEAHDRVLIVQGDDDITWGSLEIQTDRPARAALQGAVSLQDGTLSPGGHYVPLDGGGREISGGDALLLCAVGQEGPIHVSLRDGATRTTVFEQTMHVEACPVGVVGNGGGAGNAAGNGRKG